MVLFLRMLGAVRIENCVEMNAMMMRLLGSLVLLGVKQRREC